MPWYVASLRHGDTHRGQPVDARTVQTRCERVLRPLAQLAGKPPDPQQI
jgi:hypothetical protein